MSESNGFWTEIISINKPHMSQLRKKIYQQSSPVKNMTMYRQLDEVMHESPWTMMFTNDMLICSEKREQVEENLRSGDMLWRDETECMCVGVAGGC